MKTIIRSVALILVAIYIAACGTSSDRGGANINTNAAVANASASRSSSPAATISPAPPLSPLPPDATGIQAAVDVVREYYAAVNARDFRKAYELWSGKGQASGKTFEEFREGYLDTESVELETRGEGDPEGAAGSQYVKIPVRLKARMTDGKDKNFRGEYTLRRSMVDGATPEQRSWRIYSAEMKELDQ